MPSLNDFIIVTVVNALSADNKKETNYFTTSVTVREAALKTIYKDSIGNQHAKSDIQKQAYPSSLITTVRQAYGLTGTDFTTHTPYVNGRQINLDDKVYKKTEIMLVKNTLNLVEAIKAASIHRILPERTGS